MKIKEFKSDVAVIGAGIAGLRAALAASERGAAVMVISKGASASPAVIGFNAPMGQGDSADRFMMDTLNGGDNISDCKLVELLCVNASNVVMQYESHGFHFDRNDDGFDLLQPLGCGCPRLVHQSNHTGAATIKLMLDELKLRKAHLSTGITALELLKNKGRICGVMAADLANNEIWMIETGAVVLANGGGGGVYADSTYPESLAGDGYAMAFRAGASLVDMEFVQFEPCRCIWPHKLGISTTLLAKGGELLNCDDERFILKSHPGGEGTVSKGMLARLIAMEIRKGKSSEHGGIYLDLRMLPEKIIKHDHAMYYERFMNAEIDLTKERIEIAPVAHTFMGGVKIDVDCGSGVPGLFAAGEVTGGIHGANRLGGNAGTEIYVFGKIAGNSAAEYTQKAGHTKIPVQERKMIEERFGNLKDGGSNDVIQSAKDEIKSTMGKYAGVVRCANELEKAHRIFDKISAELNNFKAATVLELIQFTELKNMLLTAELVVDAANLRQESRGVHFREDFPERDDRNWRKSIEIIPKVSTHNYNYLERN